MRSELPAVRDRPQAVLEERRAFRGDPRGLKTLDWSSFSTGASRKLIISRRIPHRR